MKREIYSDFDILFRQNELTGDIVKKKNTESIKQSLALLFKTRYYDRKWHPEIGSYFADLLFKPNEPFFLSVVKTEAENLIKNYEPRIRLLDLKIFFDSVDALDRGEVKIEMIYEILDLSQTDTFVYVINRVR